MLGAERVIYGIVVCKLWPFGQSFFRVKLLGYISFKFFIVVMWKPGFTFVCSHILSLVTVALQCAFHVLHRIP